jgi:hypothetical protein
VETPSVSEEDIARALGSAKAGVLSFHSQRADPGEHGTEEQLRTYVHYLDLLAWKSLRDWGDWGSRLKNTKELRQVDLTVLPPAMALGLLASNLEREVGEVDRISFGRSSDLPPTCAPQWEVLNAL